MKQFLSFFAIGAIVLGMASCGEGNDPQPEAKDFQFKVTALSNKAQVEVTSSQQDTYFYAGYASEDDIKNAGLSNFIEHNCLNHKFDFLVNLQSITKNSKVFETLKDLKPDGIYYAFAFFVEKDEETGYPKIVGTITTELFTTLPLWTLNGVFTVSKEGKKVRFTTSNAYTTNSYDAYCALDQWTHKTDDSFNDQFEWNTRNLLINSPTGFSVLNGDEWWYLFLERKNADALLTLGTVNNVPGLILLPDDWQTPYGSRLTTAKEMDFKWDPEIKSYMKLGTDGQMDDEFDGFSKNIYTQKQWEKLEFAGAVFLPAIADGHAWYWTSTDAEYDQTNVFSIATYELDLIGLQSLYGKDGKCYIRPVRELK